ncbi:hypothetical protein FOL47_008438 [Perkinsus chesapeaki]|uniref:Uncharacterized protein n=1 Tax=Perkinsus chesapeaki TaxID=330153 RepID=A0A7J6LE05_PERCH|nr:hypothetical protein FOL47_008438 [Perkinsus chesapeaki]
MPNITNNTTPSLLVNKSYNDILDRIDLICADMDVPVVPATGRCRWSAAKCFTPGGIDLYSRPGIYLNGCVVYDQTGSVAAEKTHTYEDVVAVVNNFKNEDNVVIMCCSGDHVYAPYNSPKVVSLFETYGDPYPEDCGSYEGMLEKIKKEDISVHMIHIMSTQGPLTAHVLEKAQNFAKSKGCTSAQSLPFLTDIIPAGANKGFGVDALKEKLGYKCVACIGDALNDYQMLQEADVSFAMGNAMPEIKKLATMEVNPNSAEVPGVADLVDRVMAARRR